MTLSRGPSEELFREVVQTLEALHDTVVEVIGATGNLLEAVRERVGLKEAVAEFGRKLDANKTALLRSDALFDRPEVAAYALIPPGSKSEVSQ